MPEIIDTIRFLEWGKPAPSNSDFKGIVTTERVFGNARKGSYFNYTSRSGATEATFGDQITMVEGGFIGYTSREYAAGATTYSSIGVLNKEKIETFRSMGREAFSKKGDLLWDAVIALESFDSARKHNLNHTADYAAAISKVMPQFFRKVGLDPENMIWWMNYHQNTKHPHIHVCFLEKIHTRNRGKFTPKELKEFKRLIIKELTARDTIRDFTGSSVDEAFRIKDAKRNELLKQIWLINFKGVESISELAAVLPKSGRLQYNSVKLGAYREKIDKITESFLNMPEIKPAFDLYMESLDLFDQVMNKDAGTDIATLKSAEVKKLYSSIGNIILKAIRDTKELSGKNYDTENEYVQYYERKEMLYTCQENDGDFQRYDSLKEKLLNAEIMSRSNRKREQQEVYLGLLDLLQTNHRKLKAYILHRLAKMEYVGQGCSQDIHLAERHCIEAINFGSKRSYPLLSKIYFGMNDPVRAMRALFAGKADGDPVSMYLLGKEMIHGIHIEKDRAEGLRCIRQSAEKGFFPAKSYLINKDRHDYLSKNVSDSILTYLSRKTSTGVKDNSVGSEVAGYLNNDDEIRITPTTRTEAEIDAYLKGKKAPIRRTR